MNSKVNLSRKSIGASKVILQSGGMSGFITILISMGIAWMIYHEKILEDHAGYAVMGTMLLASFIGSVMACKKHSSQRLMTAMVTGVLYFLMLMAVGLLVFDGSLQGVGETVLLILCGSILGAMWTSRGRKTGKFKIPNC